MLCGFFMVSTGVASTMKLSIRALYSGNGVAMSKWQPDNEENVCEFICLQIGEKGKKAADEFYIRVATPKGLETFGNDNGIIASRPLLVMARYNFRELREWLEKIILSCEDDIWIRCVERLRYYFSWEYDEDYRCR
jgi:hypothetical protein